MARYKAQIIDYEVVKPGYYYPIFEYHTPDGRKTHTERRLVDPNPFNEDKHYTLIESPTTGHVRVKMSRGALKKIFIAIFNIFLAFTLSICMGNNMFPYVSIIIILLWLLFSSKEEGLFFNIRRKMRRESSVAIIGKVVGHKETISTEDHISRHMVDHLYYRIIEYNYKNKIRYHVSSATCNINEDKFCLERQNSQNLECIIYVHEKSRTVFDDKEIVF